jgi:hypothetical protein
LFSLTSLTVALAAPAAAEQDNAALRSASRKLAQDGVTLLQQNQPEAASQKLEKAYELLQVPSVALWSARALVARGHLIEAAERYVEAGRLTGFKGDQQVQLQAQKDAARELEALTPRIPTLVIIVPQQAGDRPVVTLDAKPVPMALIGEEQPVNPGAHEIKVSFGARVVTRIVSLGESEKKRESITPDVTSSPPVDKTTEGAATPAALQGSDEAHSSSMRRTLSIAALAAGGTGLLVGGVTGGLALSKRSTLADSGNCRSGVCLRSEQSNVESLNTMRTVSTVGFVVGGVLAATGVVLILTERPHSDRAAQAAPRLALRASGSSLDISGVF